MDDGMDGTTEGGMDDGMDGTTESGVMDASATFSVTVENVSEPGTITTSAGDDVPVPLSPTTYAVHDGMVAAFTPGEAASPGVEQLAEDGVAGPWADELAGLDAVETADAVATPQGADSPGPLFPGDSYEFTVDATADQHLSIGTMFVQSNDLFYAFDPSGLVLFEDGEPIDGDVTDALTLWDAGTEANQEPGAGADQAPRQDAPDTGPAEDAAIRSIDEVADGYDYPPATDVIRVTVSPN
jgi:hypothetical protein